MWSYDASIRTGCFSQGEISRGKQRSIFLFLFWTARVSGLMTYSEWQERKAWLYLDLQVGAKITYTYGGAFFWGRGRNWNRLVPLEFYWNLPKFHWIFTWFRQDLVKIRLLQFTESEKFSSSNFMYIIYRLEQYIS